MPRSMHDVLESVGCWLVVNQRNWVMDFGNTESAAKAVALNRNRCAQNEARADRYRVVEVAEVVKEDRNAG